MSPRAYHWGDSTLATAEHSASHKPPAVDITTTDALSLEMGSTAAARAYLRSFLAQLPERVEAIDTSSGSGAPQPVVASAQNIAVGAERVGAGRLAQLAEDLVALVAAGALPSKERISELRAEVDVATRELEDYLGQHEPQRLAAGSSPGPRR